MNNFDVHNARHNVSLQHIYSPPLTLNYIQQLQ